MHPKHQERRTRTQKHKVEFSCVELFCGIGGFRLATDAHGLKTIWANDNCQNACQVYRQNFDSGELIEGDIDRVRASIPEHDLLTAGFPCQPFSSAGKKRGIGDPRGTLFQEIVETLRLHHPRYFILENVKRLLSMDSGTHFATILHALSQLDYLLEWRLLNATSFGLPQNRQRVIIVGVSTRERHTPPSPTCRLGAPKDFDNLTLRQYDQLADFNQWHPITRHKNRFPYWGIAYVGKFCGADLDCFSDREPMLSLRSLLEPTVDDSFDFTESTIERISGSDEVNRFVDGVQILSNQKGGARMGYTVFGVEGIAPALTATASRHYERYRINNRYRRLTNIEYAHLQGFPQDHCRAVSTYHQYALYGNAVPPPMVSWVLSALLKRKPTVIPEPCSLFSGCG